MPTMILALALFALQVDLKPLPEERQLVDFEHVALVYTRIEAPEVGDLGWTKTTVQRVQLDGSEHYFVHRLGELIDFESVAFTTMETRGLYDSELNLVREVRNKQPLGGKAARVELEWGEKGLRWRMGRGRWTEGAAGPRPTAETDTALHVHGLSISTPWVAQIFDIDSKKVEAQTIQPGEKTIIDDDATTLFRVEGSAPLSHLMRDDGGYMGWQEKRGRAVAITAQEGTESSLRQSIADSSALERLNNHKLPAAWKQKKGVYTNAALGLSLKLPKGWQRADAAEIDGTHFHALSKDSNAYVSIAVTGLGTGYTLEGWSEGLIEAFAGVAVDGEVERKEVSFAKQTAVRFEFVQAGKAPLESNAYAFARNGFGFLVTSGTWDGSPKKLHKETSSILKSLKLAR